MNRVTPQTPIQEILHLMRRDGYVLMENALSPAQVRELSAAYSRQLEKHLEANPLREGALRVEIPRIRDRTCPSLTSN